MRGDQPRQSERPNNQAGARSQVASSIANGSGNTLHEAGTPKADISQAQLAMIVPRAMAKMPASNLPRTSSETNCPAA